MRTHHGTEPKLEWSWQSDAETIGPLRPLREAAHGAGALPRRGWRGVASATGMPMWRGLMVAFPDDATAWRIKDEVLLGDGVLVAPVHDQGRGEAAGVPARGALVSVGRRRGRGRAGLRSSAPAPLTEIPVFAAAGSVVPTYPDGVMTLAHGSAVVPDASSVGDDRIVYAFLGASGAFTEDGGLGYELASQGGATGALAASWNGHAIAACGAAVTAPCLQATADGAKAHVVGPGSLASRATARSPRR